MASTVDKLKKITYDLDDGSPVPAADQFLVSLTARGTVGTVYHIAEVRQVKSKVAPHRYVLSVYTADDLKPHTEVKEGVITVKGQVAFPLVWYPRSPEGPKFHPSEVSERQIFGDFLALQTAGAACLLVLLDGKVYRYGQWAHLDGLQHVLGWCSFVDEPAYVELVSKGRPTWYLPTAQASGYKVPESNPSAHMVINTFQAQVQHDAAVLYYYGPEWQFGGWMCYRKDSLEWAQQLNATAASQVQGLWHNHRVSAYGLAEDPYGFSAATYEEVMARVEFEQNEAVRRESENPNHSAETREALKKHLWT